MKKILSLILTLIISLLCLASCNIVGNVISPDSGNEAYLYESFTITEEAILNEHIGEIIPFAPTNEYYFRGYSGTTDFENGVNYYTVGNSYEEYENETIYQLNHDNDSGEYDKSYLIELVGINLGILEVPYFIFTEGMVIGGMVDDTGEILDYVITVDAIDGEKATLTFKKVK